MATPPNDPGSPGSGPKPNPSGPPRPGGPPPAARPRQSLGGQLKIPGGASQPPPENKPPPNAAPAARPGAKSGVNLGSPLPVNKPPATSNGPVRPANSQNSPPPRQHASAGRIQPPGQRPRTANVGADREALGLSSMKPSEMIAGLDAAVKRAEAQEQRENAKRKGGGKIDQNTALHVSDTGVRQTRMIVVGIVIFVLLMAGIFGAMFFYSNFKSIDPHKGNEATREWLGNLKYICEKMKRFADDDSITIEKAKERVIETIDARIKVLDDEIDLAKNNQRPPNLRSLEEKRDLVKVKEFKDPFGQPFEFKLDGDKLQITARGKPESKGAPSPIVIELKKRKVETP